MEFTRRRCRTLTAGDDSARCLSTASSQPELRDPGRSTTRKPERQQRILSDIHQYRFSRECCLTFVILKRSIAPGFSLTPTHENTVNLEKLAPLFRLRVTTRKIEPEVYSRRMARMN